MTRSLLLSLVFAAGLSFAVAPANAGESATTDVAVNSTKSVNEIAEYVEAVDRRLQKGRYDSVEPKQHQWIIDAIADVRDALKTADAASPPSADLQALAGAFETGMIKVEEGGIVCRQERRTGSHAITQRCFTRKRLAEDAQRSRDQLRAMPRPQGLSCGGGPGQIPC